MAVDIRITGEQLAQYERLMANLGSPAHNQALLEMIGGLHESQVRRRISSEQTAPDGSTWPGWSEAYARTRHGNQGLLNSSGLLLDSITFVTNKTSVRVGSPMSYAGVHQDGFNGMVNIPAHTRRITQAFGRALKFPVMVNVAAHNRPLFIPARTYLGLSKANQREMMQVIGHFWQERMQ